MDIKDILEKIALPARSNKRGFKETDKLEAIEKLLSDEGSSFHIICKTPHTWIFAQKEVEAGDNVVLVSSHADIVPEIKNPYSELNEETHYFKGTYDNLGTNAAAVYAMLSGEMPDNAVFAFTDEEETGRCLGAEDALSYVRNASKQEPIVFALDVTDEGYDNNRLFTIEGLHCGHDALRRFFLNKMLSFEGDEQSFEVVKLKKADDVSMLPQGYVSDELTVFDESVFYARKGCTSCSICLPGEGAMHSDSGFYVKEPVMRGYAECLTQIILGFCDKARDFGQIRDEYVKAAKEVPFRKKEYISSYIGGGYFGAEDYQRDRFSELTDEEYMEMVEYNRSFGLYGGDESYDYFVDQMLAESYEIAEGYNDDEFEVYVQDMATMYGVAESDYESLRTALWDIWKDVKYNDYDADEDYEEDEDRDDV